MGAYLGLTPRISNSNETERLGRITQRGSKRARTALVPCGLIAKQYSPRLHAFHARVRQRKGGGKANVALARKLLEIICRALKSERMFEDFASCRRVAGGNPLKWKARTS